MFLSCWKCGLSRHSENYAVDKHDKGPKRVYSINPVNIRFTAALEFNICRLQKQCQEENSHISGKIDNWAKEADLQMKTAVFKVLNPISVLSVLKNFKTACDSNRINESATMRLFPCFILEPTKPGLSHWMTADIKKYHLQERKQMT